MDSFDFCMVLTHVYWAALMVRTQANPLVILLIGFVWFVVGLVSKFWGV